MINKVGVLSQLNVVSQPNFKAEQKDKVVQKTVSEMNDFMPISNYGIASINMAKKFEIKPVEPMVSLPNIEDSIAGEKIYTSSGKLYSIVDENEKNKTIYVANPENDKFFDLIIVTDKESGNLLKKQVSRADDEKYEWIGVEEYSPETGKVLFETRYSDGKIFSNLKYLVNEKGEKETIVDNRFMDSYSIIKTSPNGKEETSLNLSKDFKYIDFEQTKSIKNKEIEIEASFYNGGLISISEEKKTYIPNLLGRESLNDENLIPARKYEVGSITPDFEGETTYYSNGAVESITIPDGTAYFNPDGQVLKLVSPTVEIEVAPDGSQIIVENLGDDATRTTVYEQEGDIVVSYSSQGETKELVLDSEMKPKYYEEVSDEGELGKAFRYSDRGFLSAVYKY